MRFIIRNIQFKDSDDLYRLAGQGLLYSLAPDRNEIEKKIATSIQTLSQQCKPDKANLIFVVEDLKTNKVVGSSQMMPHYISHRYPHFVLRVRPREAGGQTLKLHKYTGGMSLLCGLLVDPEYRRRPELIGRQVSLMRLLFAGMVPDFFEPFILGELLPPLDENKNNPFWEEIGKKYTGLCYEDALKKMKNREYAFIEDCFPKEQIVISPEQTALHRNRKTVFPPTIPSQRIIEKQGLQYLEEVDPVDGGLEYGVELKKVTIIRAGGWLNAVRAASEACTETAFAGVYKNHQARGGQIQCKKDKEQKTIGITEETLKQLNISPGEQVFTSSI